MFLTKIIIIFIIYYYLFTYKYFINCLNFIILTFYIYNIFLIQNKKYKNKKISFTKFGKRFIYIKLYKKK